jgi:hypothetical protein
MTNGNTVSSDLERKWHKVLALCSWTDKLWQTANKVGNINLQVRTAGVNHLPTIINGRLIHGSAWKPTTRKKDEEKSATRTSVNHKVKILGDSHLRGTASKIDQHLNTKFDVSSWIKPEQPQKK